MAMLIGTFGIGFFCGSLSQQRADAQLKAVTAKFHLQGVT
jgi:hypothetical protein